jgi:sec-independent protein translocase protein TatA
MKIFDNPIALVVVLVIVLMIFGVGKLPEVGQSLGKAIRGFREGAKDAPAPTDPAAKAEVSDADVLAIAKKRLAKGEITKAEYDELKKELA